MATSTYGPATLVPTQAAAAAAAAENLPSDHVIIPSTILQVPNSIGTQLGTLLTVSLVPGTSLASEISTILSQPASDSPAQIVCLTIANVPAPANRSAYLRVFIDAAAPTLETAVTNIHFVGNVGFFCCGMEGMLVSFYFDITPTLRKLAASGQSVAQGFNVQVLAGAIRGAPGLIVPPLFQVAIAALSS